MRRRFLQSLAFTLLQAGRVARGLRRMIIRAAFRSCGRDVRFDPGDIFSYENIDIGNDVYIGPGATFVAEGTGIEIGNKVLFGPNVSIFGGNHNSSVVGKFMFDVKTKRPGDDQKVTIENDVWVGGGATILKGVRLSRGCIVAAGAVVTKDVSPYVIVAGVPAKVVGTRFCVDDVLRHELALYSGPDRLSRESLGGS
jgi:acetyltransferase-like isoleucine patch superfamily enzyme